MCVCVLSMLQASFVAFNEPTALGQPSVCVCVCVCVSVCVCVCVSDLDY